MNRPTRETPAGRAYLELRRLARDQGRGTDELSVTYVLERFLYRLSADHRQVGLEPLEESLAPLAQLLQSAWAAFLKRAGLADEVPSDFAGAISDVIAFADPLLSGKVTDGDWDHVRRRWVP